MKRILFLAASVAMVASSSALAADAVEYIPEAPAAVEMPAAFSWSGPYIGLHGGYGWGDSDVDGLAGSGNFDGGRFGGFVGYNWQMSNGFVAGLEGDINYDWNEDEIGTTGVDGETGFSGSVRGRVGYAMDRTLIYAAGGWTATNVELSGAGVDESDTAHGWTLGAGIDHAFTDNVFGRLEYRYNDYSNADLGAFDADFDQHVVQVGIGVKF
ncbi:outer membrane protein [Rhizobium halophilum]|uniref:outer membrane protein n=1 Tax=Rhizobium halophilum TaxID=2846852 RepID=UPI001EFC747A|nr:outer membrane protein [Rhizobium halophilum]MCF6370450.1 porin family protein [Rhizobium halophilum]